MVTHNWWSNAVCDTNVLDQHPLDFNNLSGEGEIIGVVDTGIDMKSCYFRDDNCTTPFSVDGSVIDHTCRKVVQYVTYTDNTDWEDGHGSHVAGSAAGRSILDYGDYMRYNGNAPNAKIAFFDVGVSATDADGKSNLQLPSNYNTQIFQVLYKSGARVMTNSWGNMQNTYDSGAARSPILSLISYTSPILSLVSYTSPILSLISYTSLLLSLISYTSLLLSLISYTSPLLSLISYTSPLLSLISYTSLLLSLISYTSPILSLISYTSPLLSLISYTSPILSLISYTSHLLSLISYTSPILSLRCCSIGRVHVQLPRGATNLLSRQSRLY